MQQTEEPAHDVALSNYHTSQDSGVPVLLSSQAAEANQPPPKQASPLRVAGSIASPMFMKDQRSLSVGSLPVSLKTHLARVVQAHVQSSQGSQGGLAFDARSDPAKQLEGLKQISELPEEEHQLDTSNVVPKSQINFKSDPRFL